MKKITTSLDSLSKEDIVNFIKQYDGGQRKIFDDMWSYYIGKNTTILKKDAPDPNNPDNRTSVPYGRKIITTFTGYAYRPRYITYKSDNEAYLKALQEVFDTNNEHIKTSIAGRNTGIYGVSYELAYIYPNASKAEIRFATIDPREMILIYDDSIEPEKKFAIRYYRSGDNNKLVHVFVYTGTEIIEYQTTDNGYDWGKDITEVKRTPHYFGEVPVISYYLGDDRQGLIEPVRQLIDDYDEITSGSINEFNRYASAYLRLVGMSLGDQVKSASPNIFKQGLALLSRRRVFEQLKDKDDVTFLTKDIPTEYIKFMSELIRDQIHIQSHVPDLGSSAFRDGVSGVAVQRLMFDFENVVSTAEAEFDDGLYERIRIITRFLETVSMASGGRPWDITISHKRNAPLNLKEFADTAQVMANTGFSRYLVADIMPDDIIPDVEAELARQDEDKEMAIPDVETEDAETLPVGEGNATQERKEERRE